MTDTTQPESTRHPASPHRIPPDVKLPPGHHPGPGTGGVHSDVHPDPSHEREPAVGYPPPSLPRWIIKRGHHLFRSQGLQEELMVGILLGTVVLVGLLTGVGVERWEEMRSKREARLVLLEQQQEMCVRFADAVPRAISLVDEYKRFEMQQLQAGWLAARPGAKVVPVGFVPAEPPADEDAGGSESLHQSLMKQWREGTHYITACQIIEVRFPKARAQAEALRRVLDIWSEVTPDTVVGSAFEEFKAVRRDLRGCGSALCLGEGSDGMAAQDPDAAASDSSHDAMVQRWHERFESSLANAEGWRAHLLALLEKPADSLPPSGSGSLGQAMNNTSTAFRIVLKRAAEILYLEVMKSIGEGIRETQAALGL